MPVFTAWRSLTNIKPGVPQGTIADTPAIGFQFRYSVAAEYDAAQLGIGFTRRQAKLTVAIFDADLAQLLFQSTISVDYMIVTLGFGGLVLYTWNVGTPWRVETVYPPQFDTLGGEQPYADPGGGSDYTDDVCRIQYELYSGIYLIPLPAGAVFRVLFHNEGMEGLRFLPVQTRVLAGGGIATLRTEADGVTRLARVRAGGGIEYMAGCDVRAMNISGAAAWHWGGEAPKRPLTSSIITTDLNAINPRFLRLQGRLGVIYDRGASVYIAFSPDDGKSWEEPMELTNGTRIGEVIGPDGGTLYLLVARGGRYTMAVCSRELLGGAPRFRVVDKYKAVGLEGVPAAPQALQLQNGVMRLICETGGAIRIFVSRDYGRSWQ